MPTNLSIRQMAAQCVMVKLSQKEYYTNPELRERLQGLVKNEMLGGICVSEGSLTGTASVLAELQRDLRIPFIVAGDFEYGLVMRLDEGTSFPHNMALGRAGSPEDTKLVASCIAREMNVMGIHWNFAPVVDVNSNPLNPIINVRSFGEDAELVGRHGAAFIEGLQQANVLACAKHFPGHGDTAVDSHLELPLLNYDRERLDTVELAPFRTAIAAGVRSVMVGHLSVPALDDSATPASLSKPIVTGLLREEMGFGGIIVSDALEMKAITNNYSNAEATRRAFMAGNDVILIPPDAEESIDALEWSVKKGEISRERLQQSGRRLQEAKRWAGAIRKRVGDGPGDPTLDLDVHRNEALRIAAEAVESFGEFDTLIPLSRYTTIAGFALVEDEDVDAATTFFRYLAQTYEGDCHFAFVNHRLREDEVADFIAETRDAELVVFPIFARARAYKGSVEISGRLKNIAARLGEGRPTIAALFGNPYIRESFEANAYVCAYSDSEGSLAAAAHLMATGRKAPRPAKA